jgi:hypothetical protein
VVEAGFYIQLINAFLPDLLSVLNVTRMIRFNVFSHFARSQKFMNWCHPLRTNPANLAHHWLCWHRVLICSRPVACATRVPEPKGI